MLPAVGAEVGVEVASCIRALERLTMGGMWLLRTHTSLVPWHAGQALHCHGPGSKQVSHARAVKDIILASLGPQARLSESTTCFPRVCKVCRVGRGFWSCARDFPEQLG